MTENTCIKETGADFSLVWLAEVLARATLFHSCHLVFPYAVFLRDLEPMSEQATSHVHPFNSHP